MYDETGKERRTVINTAWTCFQFKGALSGATRRGKRISRIVLLGGWMAVMVGVRRPRASTINVYKRRIETKEWGKVRSRRRQPQTYHGRSVVRGTWHALRLFVSLMDRIAFIHSLVLCFSFAFALSFSRFSPALPHSISFIFALVATPFYTFVLRFCFFPTFSSLLFSPHFSLPLSPFSSVWKDPTRFDSFGVALTRIITE